MDKAYNKWINVPKATVNKDTGELEYHNERVLFQLETSNFYFTFPKGRELRRKITSLRELHVLEELCGNLEYNKGYTILTPRIRKEMAESIGISLNAFNIILSRLNKKGIVYNNTSNEIYIDPTCFWRGLIKKRNKLVEQKYKDYIRDLGDTNAHEQEEKK